MTAVPALTADQIRELERELRRVRARVERMMADHSGTDAADVPSAATGVRAEGGHERTLDALLLTRHRQLTEALRRVEAGEYGTCQGCRKTISYHRLIAVPEATRCIGCAGRR